MKIFIIISILLIIVFALAYYSYNNIKNNITAEFIEVKVSKLTNFANPKVNLRCIYDITNNSKFEFSFNNVQVSIYDLNGKLLGSSKSIEDFMVLKGKNTYSVEFKQFPLVNALTQIATNNRNFEVRINFNILGKKIEIKENVNL